MTGFANKAPPNRKQAGAVPAAVAAVATVLTVAAVAAVENSESFGERWQK